MVQVQQIINTTITFDEMALSTGHGIYCVNGAATTIEMCTVNNSKQYGIFVENSNPIIRNNTKDGRGIADNLYGIYCKNCDKLSPIIEGNIVNNNEYGIYSEASTAITIKDNNIMRNNRGIICSKSSEIVIHNNTVIENSYSGIEIEWGVVVVSSNRFTSQGTFNIYIDCDAEVYIHNNSISGGVYGIYGLFNVAMEIVNNTIINTGYGISFYRGGSGNVDNNTVVNVECGIDVGMEWIGMRGRNCRVNVTNNTINSCEEYGIYYSLYCVGLVMNNTISSTKQGIICRDGAPVIKENRISNSDVGIQIIRVDYGFTPKIVNNTFRVTTSGILCEEGSPSIMGNNIFISSKNLTHAIYSTNLTSSIKDNFIDGGMHGIYTYDSVPVIFNSTIQNCTFGEYSSRLRAETVDKNERIVSGNNSYALICCSANTMIYDQDCMPAQALQAYYILRALGYNDSNICFMLYHKNDDCTSDDFIDIDGDGLNDLNGSDPNYPFVPVIDYENENVTKDNLTKEMQNFSSHLTENDTFLVYLVNHGGYDAMQAYFCFEEDGMTKEKLYEDKFDELLDNFACKKIYVFIDCCFSGNFITTAYESTPATQRRVCISSSSDVVTFLWPNASVAHPEKKAAGSFFFHPFWERIKLGESIVEAYNYACDFIPFPSATEQPVSLLFEGKTVREVQNPQMRPIPISKVEYNNIFNNTYGIYYECVTSNITNNNVTYNEVGFYSNGSNVTILTNTVTNNSNVGISCHLSKAIIANNNPIASNWVGIWCEENSSPLITDNNISSNGFSGIAVIRCNIYQDARLVISGNKITLNKYPGMNIYDSTAANITNNTIHENGLRGIQLDYSSNNTITNCAVYNNRHGIYLWSSSSNQITNCNVYNSIEYGIYVDTFSNNNQITNCAAHDNRGYGIGLEFASNNQITNCTVYNNGVDGIRLYYASHNNIITNCNIYNNHWHGIYLEYSLNNTITNCYVYNSSNYGIYLASNNNQITNCSFYNNSYGIYLRLSSNNEIHYCNVYNNTNYGVYNYDTELLYQVNATYNWWGSADGPSGVGPGNGDAVSQNVLYDPWLKSPVDIDC